VEAVGNVQCSQVVQSNSDDDEDEDNIMFSVYHRLGWVGVRGLCSVSVIYLLDIRLMYDYSAMCLLSVTSLNGVSMLSVPQLLGAR